MRRRKRKRFGKFDCRILPEIADRQEATRDESRGATTKSTVSHNPDETDATFGKRSTGMKRQVFAALKQFGVLAAKSQDALRQKQFDSAIGPALHQFAGNRWVNF